MDGDDLLFNFSVDASALKILIRALDRYVEKWPGGKPAEQEELKHISELKAYLEHVLDRYVETCC